MRPFRTFLFPCLLALTLSTGCWSPFGNKDKVDKDLAAIQRLSVEELMRMGTDYLERGKSLKARKHFEEVLLRQDAGPHLVDATLGVADSYFMEGDRMALADALSQYTNFLAYYATHTRADYAQFQVGMCHYKRMGRVDRDMKPATDAVAAFRKLLQNYPGTDYTADAETHLAECELVLARHEIYVGDYNYDKGAFKGAASRYDMVLETWPTAAVRESALAKSGEAHFRAESNDPAKTRFQKLLEEFPDTKYAGLANRRLEQIERRAAGETVVLGEEKDNPLEQEKGERKKKKEKDRHWWEFWK